MSSHINRVVGKRLQLARKRAALSELQMAAALQMAPFDYREIEVGKRRLDAPAMLICSRMTGVPLSWFFVGYWEDRVSRPAAGAIDPTEPSKPANVIRLKLPVVDRNR